MNLKCKFLLIIVIGWCRIWICCRNKRLWKYYLFVFYKLTCRRSL